MTRLVHNTKTFSLLSERSEETRKCSHLRRWKSQNYITKPQQNQTVCSQHCIYLYKMSENCHQSLQRPPQMSDLSTKQRYSERKKEKQMIFTLKTLESKSLDILPSFLICWFRRFLPIRSHSAATLTLMNSGHCPAVWLWWYGPKHPSESVLTAPMRMWERKCEETLQYECVSSFRMMFKRFLSFTYTGQSSL